MPYAAKLLADFSCIAASIDFLNGGPAQPLCLLAGARKIFKLISR